MLGRDVMTYLRSCSDEIGVFFLQSIVSGFHFFVECAFALQPAYSVFMDILEQYILYGYPGQSHARSCVHGPFPCLISTVIILT